MSYLRRRYQYPITPSRRSELLELTLAAMSPADPIAFLDVGATEIERVFVLDVLIPQIHEDAIRRSPYSDLDEFNRAAQLVGDILAAALYDVASQVADPIGGRVYVDQERLRTSPVVESIDSPALSLTLERAAKFNGLDELVRLTFADDPRVRPIDAAVYRHHIYLWLSAHITGCRTVRDTLLRALKPRYVGSVAMHYRAGLARHKLARLTPWMTAWASPTDHVIASVHIGRLTSPIKQSEAFSDPSRFSATELSIAYWKLAKSYVKDSHSAFRSRDPDVRVDLANAMSAATLYHVGEATCRCCREQAQDFVASLDNIDAALQLVDPFSLLPAPSIYIAYGGGYNVDRHLYADLHSSLTSEHRTYLESLCAAVNIVGTLVTRDGSVVDVIVHPTRGIGLNVIRCQDGWLSSTSPTPWTIQMLVQMLVDPALVSLTRQPIPMPSAERKGKKAKKAAKRARQRQRKLPTQFYIVEIDNVPRARSMCRRALRRPRSPLRYRHEVAGHLRLLVRRSPGSLEQRDAERLERRGYQVWGPGASVPPHVEAQLQRRGLAPKAEAETLAIKSVLVHSHYRGPEDKPQVQSIHAR